MAVVIDSRMTTIGNLVFLKGTMAGDDAFDFKDHVKKIFTFNIISNTFDPSSPITFPVGLWDYENEQRVTQNIINTAQPNVSNTLVRIGGITDFTHPDTSFSFLTWSLRLKLKKTN